MQEQEELKIVPDTSVIIEGIISKKIMNKEINPSAVLIHEAVLAELEHQANQNKAIGFLGIEEIEKIKELSSHLGFNIEYLGKRPSPLEIKYASIGEIDAMIRNLAYEEDATLVTSDKTQAKIAKARGIKLIYIQIEKTKKKLKLDSYFDEKTMSVHLRENVEPFAKRGMPGNWKFEKIKDKKLTKEELQEISREIIEEAGIRSDSFIEIERPGSTIVQLGKYRIVITKPPFSDGWEITAVKPVKRLSLKDYNLSQKLLERIEKQAEGILIAGAPGMGKSTFAQALAEFYANKGKIVKTIEAPRDLILKDNITQYAISHGNQQEIHDILLLSRPDYTIFDEMRNTDDFKLFADLRLAGIGLAGVVHATNPIDAIQRFVGRIELGVIPQVIDTVIFIENGQISKVLSLQMVVKVPSGMTEADLARPVVVVTDFETKKPEFELYSYGEETVVVPVMEKKKTFVYKSAEEKLERMFRKYCSNAKVEIIDENNAIVYVPEKNIAKLIGKEGKNITRIEKELGIKIGFNVKIGKKNIQFYLDIKYQKRDVDIYINNDYLLTAKVGKTGIIKIKKNNKIGKILLNAINSGEEIKLFLA